LQIYLEFLLFLYKLWFQTFL